MNNTIVCVLLLLNLVLPMPTHRSSLIFSTTTAPTLKPLIEIVELTYPTEPIESEVKPTVKTQIKSTSVETIILTRYYDNDLTGSSTCTGTGKCIDDFKINAQGWYTYQGKVVLAAATNLCLRVTTGACGKYNTLPKGYRVYDFYDEVVFEVEGHTYTGIILDSCGACMRINKGETAQRYDIFVVDSTKSLSRFKNSGKINAHLLTGDLQ